MAKAGFRMSNYTNKKRVFKGNTRHWSKVCIICFKRKRNLLLHFKRYHPKEYKSTNDIVRKSLLSGQIVEINGFRFVGS